MLLSEAETYNDNGEFGEPVSYLPRSETLRMWRRSTHGTWEILNFPKGGYWDCIFKAYPVEMTRIVQEVGQDHSTGEVSEQNR